MSVNFTNTDSAAVSDGIKFLVHAPAGVGKTMLAATMPNPCIISAEAGLLSLTRANQSRVFGVARDIPVMEISSVDDMGEAVRFFAESAEARNLDPCLDSISEIGEILLAKMKLTYKDGRQAYGELADMMTKFIRDFRNLPKRHVYFSAKQFAGEDLRKKPAMPGQKLTNEISHFFDEVFALDIWEAGDGSGKTARYLQTQPNLIFHAKDRSGLLASMEQPNLGKIIEKIQSA